MPIIPFPTATPNRRVASELEKKKPKSHACRHAADFILLRNSIETARKMSAKSSSMNAR